MIACEWIFAVRPLGEIAALLAQAGYDALEVNGEQDRDDLSGVDGIRASGTTAICNWPTDERDLAHRERDARRRAVDYYRGCVDPPVRVGAPAVGLIPTAVERLDVLSTYEQEWAYAVEGVREVALHAGERDVTVALEAVNRYEANTGPERMPVLEQYVHENAEILRREVDGDD